jgi:hypothetical protein
MKHLLIILISFFIASANFAQKDVAFSKSNFPNQKNELTIAKKQIKNANIPV